MKYTEGYKYQLEEDYVFKTEIIPPEAIYTFFIDLVPAGDISICTVRRGYAWDGASGPTIDTKNTMRGSLEHDVKYELMRKELIDQKWKDTADLEFKDTLLADGMSPGRAGYYYRGVRDFARFATKPENRRETQTAP